MIQEKKRRIVIGLDLGPRHEPTGLCVVHTDDREGGDWDEEGKNWIRFEEQHYLIPFLERLPAGLPYPKMINRVADIVRTLQKKDFMEEPRVYVNATGVGAPVVDLLKKEADEICRIETVYMTPGDRREVEDYSFVKLGKAFIVSRLQVLFDADRIHMGKSNPAFKEMARELDEFQVDVDVESQDGRIFRVGRYDDLVTALGLALQEDVEVDPGPMFW